MELARLLKRRTLRFQEDPTASHPSEIIVFELVGSARDFFNAIRRINGLQWLVDADIGEVPADNLFFYESDPSRFLRRRVLAVTANRSALAQLTALFRKYRRGEQLPHGFGVFNELFAHVREVRPWNFSDRTSYTGLSEYLQEQRALGANSIVCSLELFSAGEPDVDETSLQRVTDKITFVGGTVFSTTVLSKIRHIEVRVEIPIGHVESLADLENISVFRLDEVMFVRPRSQALVAFGEADERADEPEARPAEPKRTSPRIALLDGVPVQNHPLLAGHIDLDDPDGFEESAALPERVHGTAMLSLILHGDLSENNAVLDERIYTRPILLPRQTLHASIEEIPEHSIPSDVLQRSIVRMLGPRGVARDVRVVCLCVADSQRPVDATFSPWARLIDSLSWEYGLLFVLAAGNYSSDLILPIRSTEFHGVPQKDADDTFLGAVVESVSKRPILSPSEAINAITVGASSAGGDDAPPGVFVPFEADGAERPSSFSATGGGVGRTIKPDIFLPGGRQAFRLSPLSPAHQSVLRPISARQLPGHEVASPPRSRGHIKGTSNSAALATRSCAEILDALSPIFENAGLSRHEEIAILKALLTHSASWGGAKALIGRYVQTRVPAQLIRNEIARIIGYGFARPEKVVECTRSRVTVIASGKVKENRGIVFRFPLPPSLASRRLQRTLTTTLAFLTPVSVAGRVYRTHNLWLSNTFRGQGLDHSLQMRTIEAHEPLVARGTVQHLIYSGESAVPFVDGDQLELQVNCKRDSGSRLVTGIPFGVAATLEVHENLGIDLYEEVRMRIAVPAAVQVGIAEIIL